MITTFSVLVENKFWVLTRVARIFSRHMFNINSLTVAPTSDDNLSLMTIDVEETKERLRKIELELKKIVNVVSVNICNDDAFVKTEMVLVKIHRTNPKFKEFLKEMDRYQARVVYRHEDIEIYEFSGDRKNIEQFLNTSLAHEVRSVVKTGSLAMPKDFSVFE